MYAGFASRNVFTRYIFRSFWLHHVYPKLSWEIAKFKAVKQTQSVVYLTRLSVVQQTKLSVVKQTKLSVVQQSKLGVVKQTKLSVVKLTQLSVGRCVDQDA